MNVWECEHPKCGRKCIGTGGAVGLRAIGWWFVPGLKNNIFCPAHRPDTVPCLEDIKPYDCHFCAGELEADKWQRPMAEALGFDPGPRHEEWAAKIKAMRMGASDE